MARDSEENRVCCQLIIFLMVFTGNHLLKFLDDRVCRFRRYLIHGGVFTECVHYEEVLFVVEGEEITDKVLSGSIRYIAGELGLAGLW